REVKTTCYHTQSDLKVTSEHVQLLTETVLEFKNVLTDEVIVHFVDEETISELHDQYFNDPSSTDCITFPIDGLDPAPEGEHILGEIFICPQVAQSYAKENLTD